MAGPLRGVITPILTPYDNDGGIARDLWCEHAKWVLGQGAHYLSPFGTTGEALSNGVAERKQAVDWLIEAGIDAGTLMPGTGVTALPETIELTRHAVAVGCAAAMVLPSFYYKAAPEDGQYRYYSELIEAVGDDRLKICLYNIPQVSGVAVSPSLAGKLARAYPDTVVAYKDSSGDWGNTKAVIAAAPDMSVFPGSEHFLADAMKHGGAGCISATMNINAAGIRAVYEGEGDHDHMIALRKESERLGPIPSQKAVRAIMTGDDRWLNLRAPFLNADRTAGEALLKMLS